MRVPGVDEALDLPACEGQQFAFGKTVELPVLPLVGVGAAGDQKAAARVQRGEVLHRPLDLFASLQRVRHFVEPVEQDQAAFGQQLALQIVGVARQRLRQLADDEGPQRAVGDRDARRRQAGGEVAQQHAHR